MSNFALSLVHGPNWDDARPIREQQAWDQHAAFMDGLVDDGFIILGGPLGDGQRTLHAVEAVGEDEISTRMSQDPWASMGLPRRRHRRVSGRASWRLGTRRNCARGGSG